eukprot:1849808-Amphidinium_carterae.2
MQWADSASAQHLSSRALRRSHTYISMGTGMVQGQSEVAQLLRRSMQRASDQYLHSLHLELLEALPLEAASSTTKMHGPKPKEAILPRTTLVLSIITVLPLFCCVHV